MGKKSDRIYQELLASIKSLKDPAQNPAQNYLTQEAIAGADFLKKGDYSQLPKGMFFDFQMPAEQQKQYQNLLNVGSEGITALGDDGGGALGLAKQYMGDKFARDAAQNYQNNIKSASDNIKLGLGQSAAAKSGNDQAVIGALQGLYSSMPKGGGFMSLLPSLFSAGTSLASKIPGL